VLPNAAKARPEAARPHFDRIVPTLDFFAYRGTIRAYNPSMALRMKLSPALFTRALPLLLGLALALPARAEQQFTARYSHSADNALTLGSAAGGEVGVDAGVIEWRSSAVLTESTKLNYGLGWSGYHFSRSAIMAVPESLQEFSVTLGASHRLNPRWLLIGSVSPGLYGDLEGSTSDAFNAPALFLANFLQSRELAWSFGLRADAFADKPVLPFVGVNWRFAPRWEFNLGFPRAGLSYELSGAVKLGLGATVQGGSVRHGGPATRRHVSRLPRNPRWPERGL
jgi:hypothetical protein